MTVISSRIGTATNLASGGSYDLLMVKMTVTGTFPEGQISFGLYDVPMKITGIQKVAQYFLKTLLTSKGSDPFYPEKGTFMPALLVGSNLTESDDTFIYDITSSVRDASDQTRRILNVGNVDPASALDDVQVLGVDRLPEGWFVVLNLITLAGEQAAISVPFPEFGLEETVTYDAPQLTSSAPAPVTPAPPAPAPPTDAPGPIPPPPPPPPNYPSYVINFNGNPNGGKSTSLVGVNYRNLGFTFSGFSGGVPSLIDASNPYDVPLPRDVVRGHEQDYGYVLTTATTVTVGPGIYVNRLVLDVLQPSSGLDSIRVWIGTSGGRTLPSILANGNGTQFLWLYDVVVDLDSSISGEFITSFSISATTGTAINNLRFSRV